MSRRSVAPIPVCEPTLSKRDKKSILKAVESGWISSAGPHVEKFERIFAEKIGVKYAAAVSSGTAALHLALKTIGIKKGDEVIIPDFSMAAVLFSVLYCGAKPIFIDASPDTRCINADLIEARITKKTKAIIAVHTYGHPCDMKHITAIARKHRIPVIEDAAEAHGARIGTKNAGSFGTIACFSFYANKIVTTGEGGMIVTNNRSLCQKAVHLRNMAFPEGNRHYLHSEVGYNYRMTSMQAALGISQTDRLEQLAQRRRKNASIYNRCLQGISGITLPAEKKGYTNVYWMYGIAVNEKESGIGRDRLAGALRNKGIGSRPFFSPLSSQPCLKEAGLKPGPGKKISRELGRSGLYLPSSSHLTPKQIHYICSIIKQSVA